MSGFESRWGDASRATTSEVVMRGFIVLVFVGFAVLITALASNGLWSV